MSKYSISRSTIVHTELDKVKKIVTDFRQWTSWSPWIIMEPNCQLNFDKDGKRYDWEGKRIGKGGMVIKEIESNSITYDLQFLKPFKSKAKVFFDLQSTSNGVEVTWRMESALPFFMFFMKKQIETMIGMDYERGLMMLKEYAETGKVNSKLEILPQEQLPKSKFIGIKKEIKFSNIKEVMPQDFEKLNTLVSDNKVEVDGVPFVQYFKIDFVKDHIAYTAGLQIKDFPSEIPSGMLTGTLPEMKVQKVRHTGKYDYLGNPWTMASMMIRNKEFKKDKTIAPFEFYINDSQTTKPEDLVTDIVHAIK